MSADLMIQLTLVLTCVGVALASAEVIASPGLLQDRALLGWNVGRLSSPIFVRKPFASVLSIIYRPTGMATLYSVRILIAVTLVCAVLRDPQGWMVPLLSGALSFLVALSLLRSRMGLNGADQAEFFVLLSFVMSSVLVPVFATRAVIFSLALTVQVAICYAAAGVSKLKGGLWRRGVAVATIWSTSAYGSTWPCQLARRAPIIGYASTWSVMVWECSFAPALLGPTVVVSLVLAVGILFHFVTALTMGLNDFLFAFAAFYPAVWFITSR